MADLNPVSWWRRFLTLPNTSALKAIVLVLLVSVNCAVLVSATAVWLRPLQEANLAAERLQRMQALLQKLPRMEGLVLGTGPGSLQPVLVDLTAGRIVKGADAIAFDQRVAAVDPRTSVEIPASADVAGLGRRARHVPVYVARRDGKLALLILPVHGAGYQSTLYGFLALEGDLNTIAGLTFYEQGETPGLGSQITDPDWHALWPGTKIVDEEGTMRVSVVRGRVTRPFEVDGISGATRTGNGVTNLLRFWLGGYGFGPFLKNLKAEEEDRQ